MKESTMASSQDRMPLSANGRATVSRRRALRLFGAAAGLAVTPALLAGKGRAAATIHRWQGSALSASAEITLAHPDEKAARRIFTRCVAEIERLERIFSLHRPDSEISRLNRDGMLAAPSHDMRLLLGDSLRVARDTGGAFDPTVQPLWAVYADHFGGAPHATSAPDEKDIAAARALVGHRRVSIEPDRIAFAQTGMAITLNGIAQGYITDRVADLLRADGIGHVLLDLGEHRALGDHPDGRAWVIGIKDPDDPERISETVELVDRAVATSGGYGTRFGADPAHHHLFDPATGHSAGSHRSATVIAPRATLADALSTALFVMPPERAVAAAEGMPDVAAILTDHAGVTRRVRV
jgi:thiamine biosynthesis lipoprotein